MRNRTRAHTSQAWREFVELNLLHALYAEDAGGAAAGGGTSSPAPAAVPAAAPAPSSGPAMVPAGGDPAAAPPAAAGDAAKPADIIGAPPVAAEPAKPTADEQRKFLADKGGKAEDIAKLTEAELQAKFDEAKGADATATAAKEIDVKLPEGFTVDDKVLGDFKALLADAKLTPTERAQKLVDMHASALKAVTEAPQKAWDELNTKWQGEVKADKELGGTNFDTMRSTIAKAITDVGGSEAAAIFEAFKTTGAANNPAIVRLVYRMSKALVEGGPAAGGAPASKGKGFAAAVQAMYPSAKNGAAPAA